MDAGATPAGRERLDLLLVSRGLAPSRARAQALIMAGKVAVAGKPCDKPGTTVPTDAEVSVREPDHPYVSRGGVKLEAALRHFGLDVTGLNCLDIGASTGGFTHCLLLHGAARVHAVDVGYGQLAWDVRRDPRVNVIERTNIRALAADALGEAVDLVVVDVSFISLAKVLAEAVRFLRPGGSLLGLVKPQFEAGREHVGRGGLVRDEEVHRDVLRQVEQAGLELGLRLTGHMASPITGKKSGNVEYLALWKLGGD
ncbi:MAG: TlyA family RNA methyltransferase [Deltaproteobacteria bacterium]|nr:TlyA family RNA methyltransferase [Deltaproteobacteria bacterium]